MPPLDLEYLKGTPRSSPMDSLNPDSGHWDWQSDRRNGTTFDDSTYWISSFNISVDRSPITSLWMLSYRAPQ